jgi:hypothetical protein
VRDIFGECFSSEFLDPDHPPKEIAENVEALNEYFSYFVSYPYQWDDKYETAQNIKRKTVLISDTDSTFLNMDPAVKWYEETFGVKLDKVGKINVCNIMVYNVTKFIEKVFYQLTTNLNVKENMRSKINMKSEFNFSRIILTKNKKQYAGQIVLQEGKLLGKPKFAVVGLSIKKVGTPKIARKRFNDILEKDMLLADVIDPLVPFMKFMEFERDINNSLRAGESSFLKPARFTAERAYKKPFTQQTVRGVRLWNAIFPNRKIPNFTSVNMLKLRKYSLPKFEVDKDGEPVENVNKEADILEFMEEIAKLNLAENILEGIAEFIQTPEIGNYGIDVIAIPKDIDQFPEELVPLADISSIINDNMKNGNILLESIGFKVIKSLKYDTVSNIIEI